MEAGFCGGFVAQWFMAALVRHPGFESRSCQFSAFSFLPEQVEFHLNLRILDYSCTFQPWYKHCCGGKQYF